MLKKLSAVKAEPSVFLVFLIIPVLVIIHISHHKWVNPESVIDWDVKSYYAYLPATIIHKDLSFEFISENPKEYNKWFWPSVSDKGIKYIVTSMGMSILYLPFFLIAHAIAHLTHYTPNGYTMPYSIMLVLSSTFYLVLGFWYLRKILRKYFNELSTILTIIMVFTGTNLLYYSSWNAAMPHSYNFGLISIFIYLVDLWHEKISFKRSILIGVMLGLISLIRPTNMLVLVIFLLWNTRTIKDIITRATNLLNNYRHILLMALFFIIIWAPQLLYWKYVSGKFFFNSYSGISGKFFWSNPQIANILFSFRKGWYVYTPIMLIATLGIILMFYRKKQKYLALSISIFVLLNIYIQASWWCWWFGGAFGLRAFIDSYGIMAFPLATIISFSISNWKRCLPVFAVLGTLTWYNTYQLRQFNHAAIHWWWMSPEAYKRTFQKLYTPPDYWGAIPIPDYPKARMGVYVSSNLIDRSKGYKNINASPIEIVQYIKGNIKTRNRHVKLSEKHNISIDSAKTIDAYNRYEKKWSIDKYVRPIITEKLIDSLRNDTLFLKTQIPDFKILSSGVLDKKLTKIAVNELEKIKF